LLSKYRTHIEAGAGIAVLALAALGFRSWLAEHDQRVQMTATLTAKNEVLASYDKRLADRDGQYKQQLVALQASKQTVRTPRQIASALSQAVHLPEPIKLEPAVSPVTGQPQANQENAVLTGPNLKILYDRVSTCEICELERAKLKADFADQAGKYKTMTEERDTAVRAVKGGTFWRRMGHTLKVAAITAGITAAAMCGSGHCR